MKSERCFAQQREPCCGLKINKYKNWKPQLERSLQSLLLESSLSRVLRYLIVAEDGGDKRAPATFCRCSLWFLKEALE